MFVTVSNADVNRAILLAQYQLQNELFVLENRPLALLLLEHHGHLQVEKGSEEQIVDQREELLHDVETGKPGLEDEDERLEVNGPVRKVLVEVSECLVGLFPGLFKNRLKN